MAVGQHTGIGLIVCLGMWCDLRTDPGGSSVSQHRTEVGPWCGVPEVTASSHQVWGARQPPVQEGGTEGTPACCPRAGPCLHSRRSQGLLVSYQS